GMSVDPGLTKADHSDREHPKQFPGHRSSPWLHFVECATLPRQARDSYCHGNHFAGMTPPQLGAIGIICPVLHLLKVKGDWPLRTDLLVRNVQAEMSGEGAGVEKYAPQDDRRVHVHEAWEARCPAGSIRWLWIYRCGAQPRS